MNIDADTHFSPREIYENVPSDLPDCPRWVNAGGEERLFFPSINRNASFEPKEYTLKYRIDAMKEAGFDKECLLIANGTLPDNYCSLKTTKYLYRAWNDRVADIESKNDCFIGIAQVPKNDTGEATAEMERAVKDLGYKSVQLLSSWGKTNIADATAWPFFEKASKLGIPLWVHEVGMAGGKLNPNLAGSEQLKNLPAAGRVFLGFLWSMQLLIHSAIFSGLLDKYPNLRFVLTECDIGWIPSYMNWLDDSYNTWRARTAEDQKNFQLIAKDQDIKLRKKPSDYMKENFYYVLISTGHNEVDFMLPHMVNKFGMGNRIMIETDYEHTEGSLDILRRIRGLDTIDEETKDKISGKNAAEALGLKWAPSAYPYAR